MSIIADSVKTKILDCIRKLNGDKSRRYKRMENTLSRRKFSFDELIDIATSLQDEIELKKAQLGVEHAKN